MNLKNTPRSAIIMNFNTRGKLKVKNSFSKLPID